MGKSCQINASAILRSASTASIIALAVVALGASVVINARADEVTPYDADLSQSDNRRIVNFSDYAVQAANFGKTGNNLKGDLDKDSVVNFNDISILASLWGSEWIPVENVNDLQNIPTNPSACYVQVADIDASSTATWNGGRGFEPIPSFTGSYLGNRRSIYGLIINRPDETFVGIFSEALGAQIRDVNVVDAAITGRYNVGIIAGKIEDSYVTRTSIIGLVQGSLDKIGGAFGEIENGEFTNIYVICDVAGNEEAGGLAGRVQSFAPSTLIVENCYSAGSVQSNKANTGGLIGYIYNLHLFNSFSTCDVQGLLRTGGLIGKDVDPLTSTIENSYFTDDNDNGKGIQEPGGEPAFYDNRPEQPLHQVYNNWDPNVWEWHPDALPTLK
jgi:hypothetical protein